MTAPTIGMMMSPTSEVTMAPNAAPMMTPTARSITLPRIANFLNSSHIATSVRNSIACGRRHRSGRHDRSDLREQSPTQMRAFAQWAGRNGRVNLHPSTANQHRAWWPAGCSARARQRHIASSGCAVNGATGGCGMTGSASGPWGGHLKLQGRGDTGGFRIGQEDPRKPFAAVVRPTDAIHLVGVSACTARFSGHAWPCGHIPAQSAATA